MKKVIPLILTATIVASGCGILPEEDYDPYVIPADVGYYRHSPTYYWPGPYNYAYTYGCGGFYGLDGSCIYYSRAYIAGPADEPVIPETQPRVMANGEPWRYVRTDTVPQAMRSRIAQEPGVSSARRMAQSQPRVRSRPATTSRSARSAPTVSSPPRRSTPRQAPTRSKPPRTRAPVRVEDER